MSEEMIHLSPDSLPMFADERALHFCLLVPPTLKGKVVLSTDNSYNEYSIQVIPQDLSIDDCVKQIRDNTDILFLPYQYNLFDSFPMDGSLKPKQRFVEVTINRQTSASIRSLQSAINNIARTSNKQLEHSANIFFDALSQTDNIAIQHDMYQTIAHIELDHNNLWTESLGQVAKGESILAPYGEIALTSKQIRAETIHCLKINGEIVLDSIMILHLLNFKNALFQRQEELYNALVHAQKAPVKISVTNGMVESVAPLTDSRIATDALELFFCHDIELRKIIEVGFGMNTNLQLINTNLAANEPYGGKHNCLHIGFGRRQLNFHLDAFSPNSKVTTDSGAILASS